jgi:hypothetical protein
VAHPGKDHREPELVRGRDHLVVAHAAAGLDERAHAGGEQQLDAIREREERVGGARGAHDGSDGLLDGETRCVDPRLLARTHADRRQRVCERSRMA